MRNFRNSASDGGKGRGLGRAVHRFDRAQGLAERVGIVGLNGVGARTGKAEAGEDRFGQRQCPAQTGDVVARLGA